MVTSAQAKLVRAPGRIIIGPTQEMATGVFPFGGKQIGKTKQATFVHASSPLPIVHEGTGEIGEMLEGLSRYTFSCFLRGYDDDAIKALFDVRASVGLQTGHQVMLFPSLVAPGKSAMARGVKLLFVPDDLVNTPALLLYHAIPDMQEGGDVPFQRATELGFPMVFECLRDVYGRIAAMGRLHDLRLVP